MRIGEINSPESGLTDKRQPRDEPPAFEPEIVKDVAGRALLVIEPERAILGAAGNFRQAEFLAQLIATKDKHPQTRERRRAHPVDAIGAYRAVEAMVEDKS